ncbi:beta-lactamase/transpeptidase-like protein [Rhizoclosmatium globosum]|uniref:Beta-lactamase/transpeptidase-like protein n=1 Tax=Rhizoclosmatium globosum TaxID=329046 RepID=A0A1Y2B5T4_9FUNG|nr:beta-lactamase/transpeptidase-like protein [Rhizoclosmatium globosum]|eukprot:ORY29465.1 beta-lactamase/transpeptidase-like protein [Rhizoclosmatium globosum]
MVSKIVYYLALFGLVSQGAVVPAGKLNVNWNAVASKIESMRRDWYVPGLAVGVIQRESWNIPKVLGQKRKEEPVTPNTVFQIGSTTKAFTAFTEIGWTTPVTKLYPGINNLVDILSHRAGLARYDELFALWSTPDEVLSRLQYLEPAHQFREKFEYCNHYYTLAGTLAGKVSGLGWDKLVQTRILDQIGMKDTVTDQNRRFGKWQSLLSSSSFDALMTPRIFADDQSIFTATKSPVRFTSCENALITHSGAISGYRSSFSILPDQDVAIIVLHNLGVEGFDEAVSFTLMDAILSPAEKLDWSSGGCTAKAQIDELMKSRDEKSGPSLPYSWYTGKFYNGAFGTLKFSKSMGTHDMSVSWGDVSGTPPFKTAAVKHWVKDIFVAYAGNGTISDATVPDAVFEFSKDGTSVRNLAIDGTVVFSRF